MTQVILAQGGDPLFLVRDPLERIAEGVTPYDLVWVALGSSDCIEGTASLLDSVQVLLLAAQQRFLACQFFLSCFDRCLQV